MKKGILMLTGVFVLAATYAFAHCGTCPLSKKSDYGDDWLATKMETMTTKLNLTEEQVPQVEALIKEKVEKKKAAKEEKSKKIDAIKDEYSTKLKAVLTEEQQKLYDDWSAETKDKGSMKGSDHDHKGSDHDHKGSKKGS